MDFHSYTIKNIFPSMFAIIASLMEQYLLQIWVSYGSLNSAIAIPNLFLS